jgi:hydroxymethylpyrimidine/phosphomethylpyrimidine kinase
VLTPPVVLAVAGTDSGGAAGLAADLAAIGHLGCHAAFAVTAVTAQDTTGVHAIHALPVEVVAEQVDAVLGDLPVAVVKTGMLGTLDVVRLVADRLGHLRVVVDPVLAATSGAVLGDEGVVAAYVDHLLPAALVATPNLDEARTLAGRDAPAPELAARLADLGCAVVLTGGPEWRPGSPAATCTDWLCEPGGTASALRRPAVATTADHGSGCTHAGALAARIAHGDALEDAARAAAAYVSDRLADSSRWRLGRGRGPVSHLVPAPSPTLQEEPA